MLSVELFYIILFACCLYAVWRGGGPERAGAAIFASASILSTAALSGPSGRFVSVEVGVLAVDVAMLVALFALAFLAERLWPLWVTGLQLVGAAGHAVKLVEPEVIPSAYAFVMAFWSYPMLFLLVFGTWNHQQRLRHFGVDKSWSIFFGRSGQPQPPGPIA